MKLWTSSCPERVYLESILTPEHPGLAAYPQVAPRKAAPCTQRYFIVTYTWLPALPVDHSGPLSAGSRSCFLGHDLGHASLHLALYPIFVAVAGLAHGFLGFPTFPFDLLSSYPFVLVLRLSLGKQGQGELELKAPRLGGVGTLVGTW